MYKTFIQVYPGALRVQVDVKWNLKLASVLNAYVRFRCSPIPALCITHQKELFFAQHYNKALRVEATRRCNAQLVQEILYEEGCNLHGNLMLAQMSFSSGQHLSYSFELASSPVFGAPIEDSAVKNEVLSLLQESIACDIPHHIMHHCMEPEHYGSPDSTDWDAAAQTLLLHALARAIAHRRNLTVDGQSVHAHLAKMALIAQIAVPELYDAYLRANMLEGIAEHLLIETVIKRSGRVA